MGGWGWVVSAFWGGARRRVALVFALVWCGLWRIGTLRVIMLIRRVIGLGCVCFVLYFQQKDDMLTMIVGSHKASIWLVV